MRRIAPQRLADVFDFEALVNVELLVFRKAQHGDSRGHFFAAAAEAMRRILVKHARAKGRHKRGGGMERVDLKPECVTAESSPFDLLAE